MADASVSAFFIDTASRMHKGPYFDGENSVAIMIKTGLLLLTLVLMRMALFYDLKNRRVPLLTNADRLRREICFTFGVVFVARVLVQMFVFWHRRIAWTEVFAEAGGIIPASLLSLSVGAVGRRAQHMQWCDGVGIILFCVGTFLNIVPEYQRHLWKQDPANSGHLFTMGWWQSAQHINYFGVYLWCVLIITYTWR
jgi:hypothetical protein